MRLWSLFILTLLCATTSASGAGADRILRRIDFEERRLGNPEELPMHWVKVEGPLMPHYVGGRFATDRKRSGAHSFRFDLNGGSIIYRYSPGQIRVQSKAHYRVETYVQTTPLTHARARLTAYFADVDRRPIASSIRHSEPYAAKAEQEAWKQLFVELSADQDAVSLVIELELLQPELHAAATLGKQAIFSQDIRGSAWFDDVTVSQVPKVKVSTDRPGNIFRRGESLSLTVLVNDRSTEDLAGQIEIRDANEKRVYQRSGALDIAAAEDLSPGVKRIRLSLPPLKPGWYEANLVMTSKGEFLGRQTLNLVLLADDLTYPRPDDRFGLIATDLPFDGWAELPEILPFLGAGRVKLAVWSRQGDIQRVDSAGFDRLLVRLGELRITPTACLVDLPPEIAQHVDGKSWGRLLDARPEDWQPQLAFMVSRHANHLDRWQLGEDGSDAFVTDKSMRQVYARLYSEFAKLTQKPDLAMPWPAWYELSGQLPATVALSVPAQVLPQQLPLYMKDIRRGDSQNLSLSLQLLEREKYGREVQIADLAQRVVYALAADAKRIDMPLPFTVVRDLDGLVKQPQELLMIVRTLVTMLGGASFRGKVPIAEGVEAFVFDKNGQGILVMWDRGAGAGAKQLELTLGSRPQCVDLWGNVTPLLKQGDEKGAGVVKVAIGPMPVFVVDIDGQLAQLRASVGFDRPLIESSFQPHTRKVHFVNPYKTSFSGTLKLKGPAGWTLNPPAISFSVNPGEKFERDLVIEFPYNSFAGVKKIEAEFVLQDGAVTSTKVPITLNLGLSDVGMQTLAIRDDKDILVQQLITNYGDKPIDYAAFATFPGQARQDRLVTNLSPGASTIKVYRFTNVEQITGKVRTGIKELAGTRILNDEVEIQ